MSRIYRATLPLLFICLYCSSCADGQTELSSFELEVIERFEKNSWKDRPISKDSLYYAVMFKQDFNISVSDDPIDFDTIVLKIDNPFATKKDSRSSYKNRDAIYPTSRSVIFENNLVVLFSKGNFLCLDLNTYSRNISLEKELVSRDFDYHWIYDGKLRASLGGKFYQFANGSWNSVKMKAPNGIPFILLEDDEFIIFRDCMGEWGGTIFFYDKMYHRIHYTESSCANTVRKDSSSYSILSNLGHGSGFSAIKIVSNPRNLSTTEDMHIGELVGNGSLGYKDSSDAYIVDKDLFGLQLFSSFVYKDRVLYIARVSDVTFIGEIIENEIEVVDILFSGNLYTHNPVTVRYEDHTLISLDHYGTGLKREISVIIIKGDRMAKINWN